PLGRRLEQRLRAILGRDELTGAARASREEGDAALQALVDRVRGVVLQRRHHGEGPGPAELRQGCWLVEVRVERDPTQRPLRGIRQERLDSLGWPGRRRA